MEGKGCIEEDGQEEINEVGDRGLGGRIAEYRSRRWHVGEDNSVKEALGRG